MKTKPAKTILLLIFFFSLVAALKTPAQAADAELSFSPGTATLEEEKTEEIEINVDTNGAEVGAVDIYLTYDPDFLEISVGTGSGKTDFDDFYPESGKVDSTNGEIIFAAFTSPENPVTGVAKVATLKVTPKESSGSTEINFKFSIDSTTDCNVVERETVEDILASVTDGSYTLTDAETELTPTPTDEPEPTDAPTNTPEPTTTPADTDENSTDEDSSETPQTGCPLLSIIISIFGFLLLAGGVAITL